MLHTVAVLSLVLCALLALLGGHHLARDRVIDNPVMVTGGLLELALVAQLVVAVTGAPMIADGAERATFIAYAVTVHVAVPMGLFLAIKERSRWGMGLVLGTSLTVAILIARILQIWNQNV